MRLQLRNSGHAAGSTLLFAIALCIAIASATPTITFPLNSQVPPVARAGQAFSFTFSPSTFTSDTTINYSLKSGPSWLSLDGETRSLSGTPPKDADMVAEVEIEATDSTGSVTMSSTLVVSSRPVPEVAMPLSEQIENFADYSAPNSLLFYPSTSFRFSFDQGTFRTSGEAGLNKYAVTLDNAPLPSWINFDAETMTFSGETPDSGSLVSPPERFGIQLIASEVIGFAETSIPFYFVVENHMLVWEDSFLDINATVGSLINFQDLAGKLELDGKIASSSDLASVTTDAPHWLKFDTTTFALSGIVPSNTAAFNVTVTAKDKFDDVAAVMVNINISNGIFAEEDIAPLNATIGEPFSFDVSKTFVDSAKGDISVSIVPETPWLSYDPKTYILSGEVPDDADASSITVTLSATPNSNLSKRASDTKTFTINVVSSPTVTPTASPSTDTSSIAPTSTSATTLAELAEPDDSEGITAGQIAIAVVVPNVILILAALLLFCCWRRRKQQKLIEKAGFVPMKKNISRPQLHDPPSLLTPSSTSTVMHHGLRSDYPEFSDDTSIFTRKDTRSVSAPKERRSFSNIASDFLIRPLRRSISDNYITYGVPSLPSTHSRDRSSMLNTTETPTRKRDSQRPYNPYQYRNFSEHSDLSGSIQITPEASYMHNYGQYRISKPPKTRNYLGSISGIPTQPQGLGHGKNLSTVTVDTPSRNRGSVNGRGFPSHGGPGGESMDSQNSWLTVQSSPRKSLRQGRPHSTMSAVTENTDVLYEYSDLPQMPAAAVTSSSSDKYGSSSNYGNTIRIVSHSSDLTRGPLLSPHTMHSSSSPHSNRPITRRGGNSPFFGGSGRTNSRAARRRSAKVVDGFIFSDEGSPSIAERDETNASLERSILSQLDYGSLASRSNSRAHTRRDVLGISYGGHTPDMVSRTRKSRVYVPGYRSPEESTQQLSSFITGLKHRPSWQDSRQPSVLSHSNLSDASSRFREATDSPPAFTFRGTFANDDKENDDTMSHYTESTPGHPREAWKNKYTSFTSNFSGRSLGAGSFRDSMGNSIRYDDDDSPQLTSAAYVERPSLLSPYSSHFAQSVLSRSPLSPGLDPSWRLTPVSPRPVDLGNGKVKEGPARRGTVRQSHGREGSLSLASFLENGGHGGTGKVMDEEEWVKRLEEQRKRSERGFTPTGAFL